jgi:hypothetical protein
VNLERYQLEADEKIEVFEFTSLGPNGRILKRIKYSLTDEQNIWNLSMGDVHPDTDEVDYFSVTNNNDTDKVLATVAASVFGFLKIHSTAVIYATGSTKARTRLYQIGISKYFSEIEQDYHILGELDNKLERFEKGKNYDGFLILKKAVNDNSK